MVSESARPSLVVAAGNGPKVKPQLGGINWRLVMKHQVDRPAPQPAAAQPFAAPSEGGDRMVTVRKDSNRPASKMGRWEIFDEPRLRRMRIFHVLSFAAGVLVATTICYGHFIAPMAEKIAALEAREAELTKAVALFEERTGELTDILGTIEERLARPQEVAPPVALGARPKGVRRTWTGDDPRKYYDTQIDTGY